ncbi:MAG TPA: hypothetical protein VF773_12505 [Verrucomicrobiae bacterium]
MNALKQMRWTAVLMLLVGLGLAFGSGLIEGEAMRAQEGQFAHTAGALAGKLFTVASVLILIFATEWQRARISARLQKVEEELDSLKRGTSIPAAV